MQTDHNNQDKTTFKEAPILAIKGFIMGSADIVPGVSGGTMALILDIYERLLNAIKSVDVAFLKHFFTFKWKEAFTHLHVLFLVPLFLGIFAALAFFTKVVPLQVYMFTHPEIVFGLFFGLIVGSIYILIKTLEHFSIKEAGAILGGLLFGLWIVNLVPADTPEHPLFVFVSGAIAICAMILPGISGSYLLLIMRKYDYLLSNIGMIGGEDTMDGIIGLIPFLLGAAVGLALFSRFLSWLLKRYHSVTIAVLIGFLVGSLYVIWPFQHREFIEQVRDTEVVEVNDPVVTELREHPNENLPEFERLGKQIDDSSIEVLTIKKKLIKSDPFIPGSYNATGDETPDILGGVIGMIVGVVLVGGLERLRDIKV
ncbi:MAG TPA: DUF368 domain-containing protein [Balneolaceae bacterium]|nr:DUF368 domain-containing protein [Balneolaceae bacterium]|tara:strand:- start:186791 stop:187897 length:1107 start_codon:yes stop_codon:yes gene_type:complete